MTPTERESGVANTGHPANNRKARRKQLAELKKAQSFHKSEIKFIKRMLKNA